MPATNDPVVALLPGRSNDSMTNPAPQTPPDSIGKIADLLPCPFCNHELDNDDLIDVLYPTGTWWREVNGMRIYFGHDAARHDGDGRCWNIVCAPAACGCGAEMHGDSREEVIEKWNRRALPSAELERDAGRYRAIRQCLEGDVEDLPQWLYDALTCSGDPEEFDAKIDASHANEAQR